MPASLTRNRQAALSALWWLYEGGTIGAILADTSAAGTPPSGTGALSSWLPYLLSEDFDLFLTGGSVAYDATLTQRAELPQLVITLDYATTVTYTDVVLLCVPAIDPGASPPEYALPFVGVIQESSPVTLLSTQSKTYRVDLYAEWI